MYAIKAWIAFTVNIELACISSFLSKKKKAKTNPTDCI